MMKSSDSLEIFSEFTKENVNNDEKQLSDVSSDVKQNNQNNQKNQNTKVYPSHPNTYSCFEHGSEDDKIYDCTYDDFKTIYFAHRLSRSPSLRQKETVVTIPYYIPTSFVSTYLAIYLTSKPWTLVNIQDRIPRYSDEWQPLINDGKCYVKSSDQ